VVKSVSTEQKVSRWDVYLDILKGVIFNSFSVFLVLIICKLFVNYSLAQFILTKVKNLRSMQH
jgi:hypothetical protein